ncbi:transposase [Clostridium sp.]|uniref:transposase n=1 Tax=Clostridium sp. TaxID=1506 RepID=UPI003D6C8C04
MISKRPDKKVEYLKMFKNYPNGFYINVKSRMKSARGAARYIGRYLGRAAIAEYRIISYDGKSMGIYMIWERIKSIFKIKSKINEEEIPFDMGKPD